MQFRYAHCTKSPASQVFLLLEGLHIGRYHDIGAVFDSQKIKQERKIERRNSIMVIRHGHPISQQPINQWEIQCNRHAEYTSIISC